MSEKRRFFRFSFGKGKPRAARKLNFRSSECLQQASRSFQVPASFRSTMLDKQPFPAYHLDCVGVLEFQSIGGTAKAWLTNTALACIFIPPANFSINHSITYHHNAMFNQRSFYQNLKASICSDVIVTNMPSSVGKMVEIVCMKVERQNNHNRHR